MSADCLKALPWMALYALVFLAQPGPDALPVTGASNLPALQGEAVRPYGS